MGNIFLFVFVMFNQLCKHSHFSICRIRVETFSKIRQTIFIFNRLVLEAGEHYGFTFLVTIMLRPDNFFGVKIRRFPFKYIMFSLKMVTFCKDKNCPSSQELLAFQNGETLPLKDRKRIEAHCADCEFCASEVEFYAHYPQSEETVATVEIPLPLLELAEALLGDKDKDFSALNKLLSENEGVKI